MNEDIEKLFNRTKMALFFKKDSAFLGALMCKLDFAWNKQRPTAATDGIKLLWNPDWFLKLGEEDRVFVLAHELWHVAYMHSLRRGTRDPKIWNYAADYVINLKLVDAGYKMPTGENAGLLDRRFRDMTTEEVYDFLMQNTPPPPPAGGTGMDVLDPGKASDDKEDGQGKGLEQIKNKIIGNIVGAIQAAKMGGMAPGAIPGEVQKQVDKFLNPKLPWEVILFQFFNEMVQDEYSLARPSRRYDDPIMPGNMGRNGLEHLAYYFDVSGSITPAQELRVASEVRYIQEELQPERLSLIQFDTKIQKVDEYERGDTFDHVEIIGKGGTRLEPVYKHIKKTGPTAAIIFSDMHVNIPDEILSLPVIWISVNNPNACPPFGKMLYIEE